MQLLSGEEGMKEMVGEFVSRYLGPDKYTNLNKAIKGVFEKGLIDGEEKDLLRNLGFSNDKNLMSAWDTYKILFDEEDLAHTFQVICQVYRNKNNDFEQEEQENEQQLNVTNNSL
jgi:hypothetical protein